MQLLSISAAKSRLSELVESVRATGEQITITKNGSPAAVLIGVGEWESLQETLFWLSQTGTKETVSVARAEVAAGDGRAEDQIRAEFNIPNRKASMRRLEARDLARVSFPFSPGPSGEHVLADAPRS